MTEVERHLAYAEAQVNHPDPQLRLRLALIYERSLPQLRAGVERGHASKAEENRAE